MPTTLLGREKDALRAAMRARLRDDRDAAKEDAAAAAVASAVAESDAFRGAGRVALYASFRGELPTRPLFDAVIAAGKVALFPRCIGDALEFGRVTSWEALVDGAFGTREPPVTSEAEMLEAGDLALVPGLAFDRAGGRLGRGRGYYDRAFAGSGVPFLCGVAYAAQLVERVPVGRYDIAMSAIATERGWEAVALGATSDTGGA